MQSIMQVFRPVQVFRGKFLGVTRAFSCSIQNKSSDKIYELRTYTIKPDNLSDYLQLFAKNIETRTAHSKLCGFWTTELGGTLNEVVHIWEYDSYAHRTAVRKALGEDKKWNTEFTPYSKPMIVKQENLMMKSASFYPMRDPNPTSQRGIYDLRTYTVLPSKRQEIERIWGTIIPATNKYTIAIGIWFTEIGSINQVHSLWSYKDADERETILKAAFQDEEISNAVEVLHDFYTSMKSRILSPTAFSPLK